MMVGHACDPSYLKGGDKIKSLKAAQAKGSQILSQK
jgi:hypothetical protein